LSFLLFYAPPPSAISTLSLHDALPIFGYSRSADTAGNRRKYLGVLQIDACKIRFRLCLLVGRLRVVMSLTAHGIHLGKFRISTRLQLSRAQISGRLLVSRLVNGVVDLIKLLAFLNL